MYCWWDYEMVQPLSEIDWHFFESLTRVTTEPSNSTPRDIRTCLHKILYTNVHTALFITAKKWKPS